LFLEVLFKIMNIKSLGYRTDFIFNQYDGNVEDHGDYYVVTTKSNVNYFWGNLLLYKRPPRLGDIKTWKNAFKKELSDPRIYHKTFAWDSPDGSYGDPSEFISEGFELDKSVVLTATSVGRPPKFNEDVSVKTLKTDEEFEKVIQIQVKCGGGQLSKDSWEGFYRLQLGQYKKMIAEGLGVWFAAYLDDKLVGSLGIFTDREVGRFQIVSTDPEYQRMGVCSTLVYKSARYAFEKMNIETLVMVADEDYHAAKIYESVGFKSTEKLVGLCWWDKSRHT
jgi:RimJ/RimL family protein N-acetyltransferase